MTKHDDNFYLEGIKEHIAAIRGYLPGSKETFLSDTKAQDAILMRLLALGEEVSHLSGTFTEQHPNLHKLTLV